jgi:hypothetical protein
MNAHDEVFSRFKSIAPTFKRLAQKTARFCLHWMILISVEVHCVARANNWAQFMSQQITDKVTEKYSGRLPKPSFSSFFSTRPSQVLRFHWHMIFKTTCSAKIRKCLSQIAACPKLTYVNALVSNAEKAANTSSTSIHILSFYVAKANRGRGGYPSYIFTNLLAEKINEIAC